MCFQPLSKEQLVPKIIEKAFPIIIECWLVEGKKYIYVVTKSLDEETKDTNVVIESPTFILDNCGEGCEKNHTVDLKKIMKSGVTSTQENTHETNITVNYCINHINHMQPNFQICDGNGQCPDACGAHDSYIKMNSSQPEYPESISDL
ncbi:hypothetical protein H4219_005781 [Mycoemilia scoparia]|uniref:Uncharacterized protein n=1 Tax=Mycoemilia scoparia TaxID=417184 RepID=A0A9W7ZT49_9FUNG|nr:hypothetical protein H4219_005781 [Mycoemilia scoparia]